jgi:hypothetical protein
MDLLTLHEIVIARATPKPMLEDTGWLDDVLDIVFLVLRWFPYEIILTGFWRNVNNFFHKFSQNFVTVEASVASSAKSHGYIPESREKETL